MKGYPEVFNTNHEKVRVILKEIFIIKKVKKLDKNDVVIHIRSGDQFSGKPTTYIPPPLSYYVNIINNNAFNKLIIVAEDTRNPVINKLLKLYPNIIYKKQSLKKDIKLMLGSETLIEKHRKHLHHKC